jgi:type IV pilus assembly protein PilV
MRRRSNFGGSTHRSNLGGFSLIEVLVALVVLSVGMIGMAAMYGQGLSAGRTAQFRTQAVNLVADMADRIRSNNQGLTAYEGAAADHDCDPQSGGPVPCSPAEMAAHDLFVWDTQVANLLPNGDWSIEVDEAALPPEYTISVTWDEVVSADSGLSTEAKYEVTIQVPNG